MKEFWDKRYENDVYAYGVQPNQFFEQQLNSLETAGKILLPGEGEGRNAVFAAGAGWQVTALDYSKEAKIKAMALARKQAVQIDYRIGSAENADLPSEHFDAVGVVFLHLPQAIRGQFHKKLVGALKPGGILFAEFFSKEQMRYSSGGPRNPEMLYSMDDIKSDFSDLNVSCLREEPTILDEGPFHRGKASVIRFVAQKPK